MIAKARAITPLGVMPMATARFLVWPPAEAQYVVDVPVVTA